MSKALHEIVAVKERIEEELLKRPGVTGVDVGYKYVGGHRTDEISIRVMVAKKGGTVAAKDKVPENFDGIVSDVIERTYFLHEEPKNRKRVDDISLQADTGNYSPVKGGISIGPCRAVGGFVFVGTLGAIVKDNATNNPMLLSNFHVMCIDNGWHVGDTMAQPGRVDGGTCPANVVGSLQRAALTGLVDCAVSSLSGRGYSCEIVDIGKVAGTAPAVLGAPVRKRGRTTGLTYGFVDSVSLSVNINYGAGIGMKTLTNQIGIRPDTAHNPAFGDHGDSGSAVVDAGIHVVGLHFAGSSDGHGIANQIANVLSALNVSMCVAPIKPVLKEAKLEKIEHKDIKEVKLEKIEHKEFSKEIEKLPSKDAKEHKLEKIEVKDGHKDFDKPVFDNPPGKGPSEGLPTLPQVPGGPVFGGGAAAAKFSDKPKEFLKPESKDIKDKDFKDKDKDKEKNESKDSKDHKPETKENKDNKENKDGKDGKDHKDMPDNKAHKDAKDHKDQPDNKGHKDNKDHKDQKDHKENKEQFKPEIKDHKVELKELEKPVANEGFTPKLQIENGPPTLPGMPTMPGQDMEQRIAQLEASVASLSTFITAAMRPDLGSGALTNETDRRQGC